MPPYDKYIPEHELYGVLGDKESYKLLVPHHDKEFLGRYPSYHPPETSTAGGHSHKASAQDDHVHSESSKAKRARQRPSIVSTEENSLPYHLSPQQTGVTDMHSSAGNSWYDKDMEPPQGGKASNKLSRRPLAPSRPTPTPPTDYPISYVVPPPASLEMSEPAQPFARATKPRKSVLKNPNPPPPPPSSSSGPSELSSSSGQQPAPLPPTAYLSPNAAHRRRAELSRYGQATSPPSAMRPPSREAPTPYWMSPATSVGRLSSAAGSHRGSSAATSSVAFTSSSFSNSNSNSNSYSYSQSASTSNTGPSFPDDDGEPDESLAPRTTLFVVNADPDSSSDRSVPVPQLQARNGNGNTPSKPAVLQRRHQKAASAPAGVPPVPALPPQFSAPPPPKYPPPNQSDRSRSAPTVPVIGSTERESLRRNASDNTSKQGHSSQPIPIPPTKPKRNGHSSGAGSLTHSSSSGSSSSNQRSASPHTPPTQVVTGTTIPAEWVHPLPLTLEQLFKGGKHEYKITRHMLDGSKKDQVVLVDVQPGWKSGTRITFPRAGNEYAPGRFQDVIFVVEQIHHERLARLDGGRLVVTEMIDLPDAMNAGRKPQTRRIVGVDGKVIEFVAPSCVIKNGMETVVKGHGMYLRSKSHVVGRGDLVIRWHVRVPDNLTPGQYERMREIFVK